MGQKVAMTPSAFDDEMDRLRLRREARFRLGVRLALSLVFLAVGVIFWSLSQDEVEYFFRRSAPAVDLGDLRSVEFTPAMVEGLKTNDYVTFRNDIIMFEDLRTDDHFFYYSPLTRFVVFTPRALPSKSEFYQIQRIYEVDPFEESLILGKKVFPEDLQVSFDGGGRVMTFDETYDWVKPAMEYMANSASVPKESLKLLLDGVEPQGRQFTLFFAMYVVAVAVFVGGIVMALAAILRYRRQSKLLGPQAVNQL